MRRLAWALIMFLLTACSVGGERQAHVVSDDAVPFALLEPDAPSLTTPAAATDTDPISLCFVQDGHLVVVPQRVESPVTLDNAVRALADPPEQGADAVRTALRDISIVKEVRLVAGLARVDLREAISVLGGDDQLLAVAQIVCTLTARPGVGQVSFTLEAAPVEVPRGDGSLVAAPVSRDDYATLLP